MSSNRVTKLMKVLGTTTTSIAVTISEVTLTHSSTFRGDGTGPLAKPPSGKLKAAAFGGEVAGTQSAEDLSSTLVRNVADSLKTASSTLEEENTSITSPYECSGKESPVTPSELGDRVSLDIPVLIDGIQVSALVDTGAEYSIISGKLATIYNKDMTPWNGTRSHSCR